MPSSRLDARFVISMDHQITRFQPTSLPGLFADTENHCLGVKVTIPGVDSSAVATTAVLRNSSDQAPRLGQ